jgi:hypothetical protein
MIKSPQNIKNDIKNDFKSIKNDIKNDFKSIKNEIKNDIHNIKNEIKNDIKSIKTEITNDIKHIEKKFIYIENNIIKICKNQDINQKIWMTIYLLFEFYRLLISSLLLIFVPQNCNGHLCSYYENMISHNDFYLSALIMNYITLFSYAFLYIFEIQREVRLIDYLDVNLNKPFDNVSVETIISTLPENKKKELYSYDYYYQITGIICCIFFIMNTIMSTIAISPNVFGTQTYNTFLTNVTFMITKIYQIYMIIHTDKNVFYSSYLIQRVQFNDIDNHLKKKIEKKQFEKELSFGTYPV